MKYRVSNQLLIKVETKESAARRAELPCFLRWLRRPKYEHISMGEYFMRMVERQPREYPPIVKG